LPRGRRREKGRRRRREKRERIRRGRGRIRREKGRRKKKESGRNGKENWFPSARTAKLWIKAVLKIFRKTRKLFFCTHFLTKKFPRGVSKRSCRGGCGNSPEWKFPDGRFRN
jgi:hypothetical protein